jgi:crotonobetainyl-CoA:carnitine CoA-transferase CaiB-like acyl-CoA transferase
MAQYGPLAGVRVLDCSTMIAAPSTAAMLADFGAEVIKIERPGPGDHARRYGAQKNGIGLYWKALGRNKRSVALDLHGAEAQALLLRWLPSFDVFIENFRPGTLERWGLGPDVLLAANPRLVIARVTAFGQVGPWSRRPGFGSLAEAMSGFAAVTGEPDGPPTLPPFGLADGITALATAYAVLVALRERDRSGAGQVIDMAIIEPILMMLGGGITAYQQTGYVQPRLGNRSSNNAPRNVYQTLDGRWVAVSTSSQSIAERVVTLVGRADLVAQPWFGTGRERAEHADELDDAVGSWIAERPLDEVMAEFEKAEAAVGPVHDIRGIMTDPQYAALGTIVSVDDDELGGPVQMQNVLFRLSESPGSIRWAGGPHGANTDEVLAEIGVTPDQLAALRAAGVV